jgi:hypothetical protein
MIRSTLQSALCLCLSPLLAAQQVSQQGATAPAVSVAPAVNPPKPDRVVRIPADTTVKLLLAQNFSSADARKEDRIRFTVENDVFAGNDVVVQAGTTCFATVTAVRPRTADHYGEVRFSDPEFDLGSGQRIRLTQNEFLAAPGGYLVVGVLGAVTLVPISVAMLPVSGVMFLVEKSKQDRQQQQRNPAAVTEKPVKSRAHMKGDSSREEYRQDESFEYYVLRSVRIHTDRTVLPIPLIPRPAE